MKRENVKRAEGEKRSAKDEALYYLGFRARTRREVEDRLKEKEYDEAEREECLAFLEECRFVNDREYCFRYVEYSMEKGRGPARIRQELYQKGIPDEYIEEGLRELYDGTLQKERARALAEKALGLSEGPEASAAALTEKDYARAARRLASQGFGSSVIYSVLDEVRRALKNAL